MTSRRTDRSKVPRTPLSRDQVLRAAASLADEGGIESLTMRKLAHELGVEAMSLYNHVANKDDILDGIVDIVYGEIDLPPSGTDWKTAMRKRAISAREVLTRHPWATALMESRATPGPANLRHHDSVVGSLRGGGFSPEMAVHAYSVLDSYIFGFTLQEKTMPHEDASDFPEMAEAFLTQVPSNEYPHLNEVTTMVMESGYDFSDEFVFGLDLILDGLERLRDSA